MYNFGNSCTTRLYKPETNNKYMRVIGLLSTEEEAKELQFIAKICTLENRIHYITKIDKIKKELVDARNSADTVIYSTEKALTETAEKADNAARAEVQEAIDALKRTMEGEDAGEIKRLTEVLTQASHKLAASMYQNASGVDPQQSGGTTDNAWRPGSTGPDDDVVDAEYREVA